MADFSISITGICIGVAGPETAPPCLNSHAEHGQHLPHVSKEALVCALVFSEEGNLVRAPTASETLNLNCYYLGMFTSSSRSQSSVSSFWGTLLCIMLFACAMLAVHPVVNSGIVDDWSYILTAKSVAQTGHPVYNGWATAILGWQLYWGALWIKLFGFSWTIVRVSTMVIGLAGAALQHRILVRLGLASRDAAIVTLGLLCSGEVLINAVTFMTDISGWFTALVCIYACIRALESSDDRTTAAWIIFASLSNALLGTVRQLAWLGVLIMVPSVLFYMRKRVFVLWSGIVSCAVGIFVIVASMHWWKTVPYALHENTFFFTRLQIILAPYYALNFTTPLTPLLIAFLAAALYRDQQLRWIASIGGALGILIAIIVPSVNSSQGVGTILPATPIAKPALCIVTAIVLASGFTFIAVAVRLLLRYRREPLPETLRLSNAALFWLLVPYSAVLLFLLLTRQVLYPRYWISIFPIAAIVIPICWRAWQGPTPFPRACIIAIALIFPASVINIHDVLASLRAQTQMEANYEAAGLPRNELEAGMILDGTYQILSQGHVNDHRITTPANTFIKFPPSAPKACLINLWFLMPAITPRYSLVDKYGGCFQPMDFPAVGYTTWYPPFHHEIKLARLNPPASF
jgi:hypothetical protein